MMDVRIVRVSVGQFLVVMDVGMWLAGWIGWLVDVVVMLVVRVEMVVRHCLVPVRVGVALGEMEPNANHHQASPAQKSKDGCSRNTINDNAAPMNGAVEK